VGPPRGGLYERLRRLAVGLAERGAAVRFVGLEPLAQAPGLTLHRVRPRGRGQPSPATLAGCLATTAWVCARHGCRLVFSPGSIYSAFLWPLRALPGRRLVTYLQGDFSRQEGARGSGAPRRALARRLDAAGSRRSDLVLAVSADLLGASGVAGTVVPYDLGPPRPPLAASTARDALGLPRATFLVGYAGAVAPIKSLDTLLRAAALVPGLHVALLGFSRQPTRLEGDLRELAADPRLLGRAHLLGWAPSERAGEFVSALDVVVLPSAHEGCPNLLLEGLARGRTCLGARVGGIEEMLVHPELLFPHGDAEALAQRLRLLRDDPGERARLRALTESRAETYRFDWEGRVFEALAAAARSGEAASSPASPS
jgi:glycosyltransferase involved in cell wall biosynthesis